MATWYKYEEYTCKKKVHSLAIVQKVTVFDELWHILDFLVCGALFYINHTMIHSNLYAAGLATFMFCIFFTSPIHTKKVKLNNKQEAINTINEFFDEVNADYANNNNEEHKS